MEKKSLGYYINEGLMAIISIPKRIKNKFDNISVVKQARNKRAFDTKTMLVDFAAEDAKDKDEKAMTDNLMVLKDGNLLKNYKFVDSKEYLEIQISDIIVSIIAKYLSFLSNNSVKYIDGKILNLNNTGKINLKKLIEIINKSDKENNFFIATVNPFQVINYRDLMNQHVEFLLNFR